MTRSKPWLPTAAQNESPNDGTYSQISAVYVIIDRHSHRFHVEEAKKFFASMAKRYGQHPHVIYEIFNEPERVSWERGHG